MRVLYIDDRIPERHLGYGFPRSSDIVMELKNRGHEVDLWATEHGSATLRPAPESLLKQAELVWLSRVRNYELNSPSLVALRADQVCVFDIEAIGSERLAQQGKGEAYNKLISREQACVEQADLVIAVNRRDREKITEKWGKQDVFEIGHYHAPLRRRVPFSERNGILFVGGFFRLPCPNEDALQHFLTDIYPLINPIVLKMHPLTVVGHRANSLFERPVGDLLREYAIRVYDGPKNLDPFYARARAAVIPTRIAAGLPFKATEAIRKNLPFVTTKVVAAQLDEVVNGADTPQEFANEIVWLLNDEAYWRTAQHRLSARSKLLDRRVFEQQIGAVLDAASTLVRKRTNLSISDKLRFE